MDRQIGGKCPFTRRQCMEWECRLWRPIQVTMPHPQKEGETIQETEWDCVIALQFVAQLDIARKTNQTGAATESLRNGIFDRMDQVRQLPRQ